MWSPDGYRFLTNDLEDRKQRYLRMIAEVGEDPQKTLAIRRGHIVDGRESSAAASARLRQAPSEDFKKAIDEPLKKKVEERTKKPERSMWTDDAIKRTMPPPPESVHHVMARLALVDLNYTSGRGTGVFEIPFHFDPGPLDQVRSAKHLVRTIFEAEVRRPHGKEGFDDDKTIRDILLDLVGAAEQQAVAPGFDFAKLRTLLTNWLDTLHDEVKESPPVEQTRQWLWYFNGGDTLAMYAAYGKALAESLLELHQQSSPFTWPIAFYVFAWAAELAKLPLRDAVPRLADYVSFDSRIDRLLGVWRETPQGAFGPLPPGGATGADDVGYRIFACRENATDRVCFRRDLGLFVPPGWVWPPCSKEGFYWWRAVVWQHCADHVLRLKDMGDMHSNDLLRFAMLRGLFGPAPDRRIPPFVGACIKAALLHFKYWLDEPGATGNNGGEMTFWSENHQNQFHTAEFLAGSVFPDEVFPRSGRDANGGPLLGREHARRGRLRVERWLDRRLEYGFSEWNSPVYYHENFVALFNLVDFSPDDRIREKAEMVVDLLLFDLARFTCRGSFAVSAGRTYFTTKAFGWQQKAGEMIELLFGTRGDHLDVENAAVALCTSFRYHVPEAILAIGLDRALADRGEPFADRSRVSLTFGEGTQAGIGTESLDDVVFWWGLGSYFDADTRDATRRTVESHPNLRKTSPMNLLWALDDKLFEDLLGSLGPHLKAIILDAATLSVAVNTARAGSVLTMAPFPLNLLGVLVVAPSVSLTIESALSIVSTVSKLLLDGLETAWRAITFQDPPEPDIPKSALQITLEALLEQFNSGNMLERANLKSFCIGDAMLASVQNHRATGVSFQKQPWLASLGCDACVWTNAPLTANSGGNTLESAASIFKHILLLQGSEALVDLAKARGLANMSEIKDEGLFEWGGSICLPKVVQHRDAAIVAYDFGIGHGTYSDTPTHAWFPTGFFDEVDPRPASEEWLPERDGGGTWVFGRKDDGYIALYSARRVKWVRDSRFDGDPTADGTGQVGADVFTTTELRAEDGSNIWVCAIGSAARYGSFDAFKRGVRDAYLHISGVGSLNQLQCTFDMPPGRDATIGGYRLELFYDDDEARVDGRKMETDSFPRFENKYVAGRQQGRVAWGERSYRIAHDKLGHWVEHDLASVERRLSDRIAIQPAKPGAARGVLPIAGRAPLPTEAVTTPAQAGRRARFRLGI